MFFFFLSLSFFTLFLRSQFTLGSMWIFDVFFKVCCHQESKFVGAPLGMELRKMVELTAD